MNYEEAKISISDALSILKVVKSMHPTTEDVAKKMLGASALEIYEANKRMQHILTGIDELDEILGGGFQRRQITEICKDCFKLLKNFLRFQSIVYE
jgi:predicted ATP-dependent serine protease